MLAIPDCGWRQNWIAVADRRCVLKEKRQLGDVDVATHNRVVTCQRAEVQDLKVLSKGKDDAVDVRELVALGVDCVVVRVPLEGPLVGVDAAGDAPGGEHGGVRVSVGVVSVEEVGVPVVESGFRSLALSLFQTDEVGVELLEVVPRCVEAVTTVAARVLTGNDD